MTDEGKRNIRVGGFVLTGTLLLVAALYFIGSKRNLFGSGLRVSALFFNVNGLMRGNNVRFAGIDVGTVESVEIVNDTAINVIMVIEKKVVPFIKSNSVASISTDGLMGNKLVNIISAQGPSHGIEEGASLATLRPVEMDDMIRTLDVTNTNVKVITANLRNITNKIDSKNSFWSVLMDTIIAENLKSAVGNIKGMSNDGILITGSLKKIANGIHSGKGSLGALLTDTLLALKINRTFVKLESLSDTAGIVANDLSQLVKKLNSGKGSAGAILNDTLLIHNLNQSIRSINKGAEGFDENMQALKHTWPFKKRFKKNK